MSEAAGSRETVLIVEDDPLIQMLLSDFLDELGYEALEASDGVSALPILEGKKKIDLMITDVGLPGMGGRQLAEIARRTRPELKILFATGYANGTAGSDLVFGKNMDVIGKPVDMEKFALKVRELIDSPG